MPEEDTEIVVVEEKRQVFGKSFADIFWMVGAGAGAALGWALMGILIAKFKKNEN